MIHNTDGIFNITTMPLRARQAFVRLLQIYAEEEQRKIQAGYTVSFHHSIQRQIGELNLPFNIANDKVFSQSRQVLTAK